MTAKAILMPEGVGWIELISKLSCVVGTIGFLVIVIGGVVSFSLTLMILGFLLMCTAGAQVLESPQYLPADPMFAFALFGFGCICVGSGTIVSFMRSLFIGCNEPMSDFQDDSEGIV